MSGFVQRLVPLLSVLAALSGVVAGAAIIWRRHQTRIESETITRPAPEYGPHAHVLLPDLDGATVIVPDRPHDPAEVRAADRFSRIGRRRSFTVETNSLGLRGPEPSQGQGPRVLALGDSVTFGWGVPYEDSYPAQLQEALSEKAPSVEVLNAGMPAMKPGTIAAWAADHAKRLEPDLVLFTRRPDHSTPDPYGDFARSVRQVQQIVAPTPVAVVMPPVSTFDVKGSQAWQEERRRIEGAVAPVPVLDLTPAFREALPLPGVVLEQEAGRQRMVRLPERRILLDVPAPPQGLAPEVVAAFEADDDLYEPLFFDGGHPDGQGFSIFALEVSSWIDAQGWLR